MTIAQDPRAGGALAHNCKDLPHPEDELHTHTRWRHMAHDVVNVSIEQSGCEMLGVVIGHVLHSIYSFKTH